MKIYDCNLATILAKKVKEEFLNDKEYKEKFSIIGEVVEDDNISTTLKIKANSEIDLTLAIVDISNTAFPDEVRYVELNNSTEE